MVSISTCHAEDPGSIPGGGVLLGGLSTQMLPPNPRDLSADPDIPNPDPETQSLEPEMQWNRKIAKRLKAFAGRTLRLHGSIYRYPWETAPSSISGLVVEYIVAIDVTRVRFPADAFSCCAV